VHVIQSRDHILNTYSEKISEYAEKKFARNDVTVWTNTRSVPVQTVATTISAVLCEVHL
jgi:NADH dehydrogenase FAD-containing subunit